MAGMILSILCRRFCLSLVDLGQWRKKWFNVSISKPQVQIGLTVSKRLCLNLCSLKWLKPTWRQLRRISPFGWLTLKTSLLRGLIKIKIFFWKVGYEGELRISESNLFHSTNADGKKGVGKKLFLILNWGITKFRLFLVWYEMLFEGIKSYKYFGGCSLTIL